MNLNTATLLSIRKIFNFLGSHQHHKNSRNTLKFNDILMWLAAIALLNGPFQLYLFGIHFTITLVSTQVLWPNNSFRMRKGTARNRSIVSSSIIFAFTCSGAVHCNFWWREKSIFFRFAYRIEIIHFYNFLSMPCTYNKNVRQFIQSIGKCLQS